MLRVSLLFLCQILPFVGRLGPGVTYGREEL
jgi:hypothetical protein